MNKLFALLVAFLLSNGLYSVELPLRYRTESGQPYVNSIEVDADKVAVIVCDMWNMHPCKELADRSPSLAKEINAFIRQARSLGMHIIHAPSATMQYYGDCEQRKKMVGYLNASSRSYESQNFSRRRLLPLGHFTCRCKTGGDFENGAYSCDESFSGIEKDLSNWKQSRYITIEDGDYISDDGKEIRQLFWNKGIQHFFIVGVHSNMCLIARSFGVFEMQGAGFFPIVVRDLVDAAYTPDIDPYVSVDRANELMTEWFEKHVCPTISFEELPKSDTVEED